MAKRRVRAVDPWKTKQWFVIKAPKVFGEKDVGQTAAQEPDMLIGRTVEVLGSEVTGSLSHLQYLLWFKINKVVGSNAFTDLVGYELERSFMKRLTRRHISKVEVVFDVETRDKKKLHVKAIAWTAVKVSRKKRTDMRKKMMEMITEEAKKKDKDELIKEFFAGDLTKRIAEELKKIAPIRRVEIAKVRYIPEEVEKVPASSS
ncbi:MAG: 30S ribosomal protein S3ae [Candidatus Diapherotrites archaeon]|nr:30S ribosomal protein S3ae [Candidatus Diapherotrites archaeon]